MALNSLVKKPPWMGIRHLDAGALGRVFLREKTFVTSCYKTISSLTKLPQVHFHWPYLLPAFLRNCCTLCIFWTKQLWNLENMFSLHKSGKTYFVLFSRLWTFTVISLSAQTSFNPKGNCKCCYNNPSSARAAVVCEGPGSGSSWNPRRAVISFTSWRASLFSVFCRICSILFFAQWFNSKFLH